MPVNKKIKASKELIKKRKFKDEEKGGTGKRRRKARLDTEIESDSESDVNVDGKNEEVSSEEEDQETAQEKSLRLAKQYIAELKQQEANRNDEEDLHGAISDRLVNEELKESGKLHKEVANQYTCPALSDIKVLRGHQLPVTCLAISSDSQTAFSGSKDGSIIKWCLKSYKRLQIMHGGRKGTEKKHTGHTSAVLSIALSTDYKFLATGDANNLIHLWEPSTFKHIRIFKGHRGQITGLAFRLNSHQLYSASADRSVKIWDLDEMAYVDTLFGHQAAITAIDSLVRERAVTVGQDRLVHIFKIPEESAIRFSKHVNSDCVALINESNFITGGEDNAVSLWSVLKKKPVFVYKNAHPGENNNSVGQENWITSVASLHFTDLVASAGSKDGMIRFWKCSSEFKSLTPLFSVPVPGFGNGLQFSPDGDFIVAAVGQEHRMGRWWRLKQAKNALYVIPLPQNKPTSDS